MIEVGKIYKLKKIKDFFGTNTEDEFKVLKIVGHSVYCQNQETKELNLFNVNDLIDPERPDDIYSDLEIVWENLNKVMQPMNLSFWKNLKEEMGGCAASAACASAACATSTAGGPVLGVTPTPALGHVSGAMVNGVPVEGKTVKKKKKKSKKNEDVELDAGLIQATDTQEDVRSLITKANAEENEAITSYLDKAKRAEELGVPALAKLFRELADDETVHTGCLQGALSNLGLDDIEHVIEGDTEAQEIMEEFQDFENLMPQEVFLMTKKGFGTYTKQDGKWFNPQGKVVKKQENIDYLENELLKNKKDFEKSYNDIKDELDCGELWDSGNLSQPQKKILNTLLQQGKIKKEDGIPGVHDTANGVATIYKWINEDLEDDVIEFLDGTLEPVSTFKEKYEEITNLIAKQLDRMNFEFADTEDIIYKKEGSHKYLLKFDNEEGYLKFKVLKDDNVIIDKEWKLEEGEDISPIFNEIENIYKEYGI